MYENVAVIYDFPIIFIFLKMSLLDFFGGSDNFLSRSFK